MFYIKSNKNTFWNLQRSFKLLISSNCANRFADSIDLMMFTWLVYQITDNPAMCALAFSVNKFVSVIIQPLVGPLVEKRNKKKLVIVSDTIRLCSLMLVIALYLMNMISIIAILCYFCVVSFVETFRIPAGTTFIRELASNENDYEQLVSNNASLTIIAEIVGVGCAGFLVSFLPFPIVAIIEFILFSTSLWLFVSIVSPVTAFVNIEKTDYLSSLKEGFIYIKKNHYILYICIISALINAFVVPFDSLQVPYVNKVLNSPAIMLSVITVTTSIGTIIGSFLYNRINIGKNKLFRMSGFILGAYYILIIIIRHLSVTSIFIGMSILSFIVGIAISFLNIYIQTEFMKYTDKNYLSRVSSISVSLSTFTVPISGSIVSIIVNIIGIKVLFYFSGILIVLSFVKIIRPKRGEM